MGEGVKCLWVCNNPSQGRMEQPILSLYYGCIGKAIMGKSQQCWMRLGFSILGFSILGIVRLWKKLSGPCVAPQSSKVYKKRLEKCMCQWGHTWSSSWLGKRGWLHSLFAVSSRSGFLQFFKILIPTWMNVCTRNLKISMLRQSQVLAAAQSHFWYRTNCLYSFLFQPHIMQHTLCLAQEHHYTLNTRNNLLYISCYQVAASHSFRKSLSF